MSRTISEEKYNNLKQKLSGWIRVAKEYQHKVVELESLLTENNQEKIEHIEKLEKYKKKIHVLKTENKELKNAVKNYQEKDQENRILERLAEKLKRKDL